MGLVHVVPSCYSRFLVERELTPRKRGCGRMLVCGVFENENHRVRTARPARFG